MRFAASSVDKNDRIIAILEQIYQIIGQGGSGGGGTPSNVTVDNFPNDYALESTQLDTVSNLADVLTQLQGTIQVEEQNPITGFNLEATQQDVLTELQNLITELEKAKDFQLETFIDTGNNNQVIIRKEVLTETDGLYSVIFTDIDGNTLVPTGPIQTLAELALNNTVKTVDLNPFAPQNLTIPLNYSVYFDNNTTGRYNIKSDQGFEFLEVFAQSSVLQSNTIVKLSNTGEPIIYQRVASSNSTGFSMFFDYTDINSNAALEFRMEFDNAGDYVSSTLEIYDYDIYEDYTSDLTLTYIPSATSEIGVKFNNNTNVFELWVDGGLSYSRAIDKITTPYEIVTITSRADSNLANETFKLYQTVSKNHTPILLDISKKNRVSTNSFTDYSGTTSLISTQIIPNNSNRKYLLIQNVSDTDIWVNFGAVATIGAGSIKLVPNGHYELSAQAGGYINTDFVSVICSVAGKEFTIKEA